MRKFYRSLTHALRGLKYVWKEERNFRTQTIVAIVVLGASIYFQFDFVEMTLIVFASLLVLGTEIINTFVEDLLDEIEPHHNAIIGKAKDMMAGAVLIHSIGASIIGITVFVHHFMV